MVASPTNFCSRKGLAPPTKLSACQDWWSPPLQLCAGEEALWEELVSRYFSPATNYTRESMVKLPDQRDQHVVTLSGTDLMNSSINFIFTSDWLLETSSAEASTIANRVLEKVAILRFTISARKGEATRMSATHSEGLLCVHTCDVKASFKTTCSCLWHWIHSHL